MTTKWKAGLTAVILGASSLGGCAGADLGNKQMAGALVGAAGGGLLGAQLDGGKKRQLAATAAGTLLGALIGSEAGKSLDRADQLSAAGTATPAPAYFPSAGPPAAARWIDPDRRGSKASLAASRAGHCREIQYKASVGGKTERVYGTACEMADGQWQLIN